MNIYYKLKANCNLALYVFSHVEHGITGKLYLNNNETKYFSFREGNYCFYVSEYEYSYSPEIHLEKP